MTTPTPSLHEQAKWFTNDRGGRTLAVPLDIAMAKLNAAYTALAAAQEARQAAERDINWLYTHCRATGMVKEADKSAEWPRSTIRDIALFTIDLKERAQAAEEDKVTWRNAHSMEHLKRLDAEARAERYKAANAILAHSLKHFADESKWGPVADYSAGYWYMTGKPWIPAAKAIEQADAAIAGEPS